MRAVSRKFSAMQLTRCTPARPASAMPPAAAALTSRLHLLASDPLSGTFAIAAPVYHTRHFHSRCAALQEPSPPPEALAQPATASACGAIEVVVGPMFAGKTSELLRRVAGYEAQGLTVAIVKSNKDDRYSASHVVTHDGIRKVRPLSVLLYLPPANQISV